VTIRAPFPWFGGKSRVAAEVWRRFGDVDNYVEPFFGSGAVLLARPGFDPASPFIETVNDMNAWLCNFWRAVSADAEAVAEAADYPVSELDIHARGDAIFYRDAWYRERGHESVDAWVEWIRSSPDHFDPLIAGWWVWGQSAWIGDSWGRAAHNAKRDAEGKSVAVTRARPHIHGEVIGNGIHRQMPRLDGNGVHAGHVYRSRPNVPGYYAGCGIHRQNPRVDGQAHGDGVHSPTRAGILAQLAALQVRLRRVRICCGDWSRVMGNTPLRSSGITGVFLDPPYGQVGRAHCYGEHEDFTVAAKVREWAIAHGHDHKLRIALCGYEGEHAMPSDWRCYAWKAIGGYGNQRRDKSNANAKRERIWFSPHCLAQNDLPLFARVNS